MGAIDLGNATRVSWAPGAVGATVVLTVTLPDGTTATPAVTESSGTYTATVATPQAGQYRLKWSIAASSTVYTDFLDVWPANPRFIIPLDELVSALRQTTPVTASDQSDMRLIIAAATEIIEDVVGAVLVRTEVQYADGGKSGVALYERPTTITSVTADGETLTSGDDYVVALNEGIVYAGSPSSPQRFTPGRQNIVITYTTGTATIKPNIRLAAIELCRHMWQIGRQTNMRAQLPGDLPADDLAQTPAGFLIPRRVLQLLLPDARKDTFG